MPEETVFTKIIRGAIAAEIVYQDSLCVAFRDISPQAPTHILLVPRRPLAGLQDATEKDAGLLGHLLVAARQVAAQEGILDSGFRCIINCGKDGGQEVPHLHVHLLGGRPIGPLVAP